MATSVGQDGRIAAEINVTPMADVMIVLLVIFMVATPLMDQTKGLTLPPAANAERKDAGLRRLLVTVRDDGTVSLADEQIDTATLGLRLRDRLEGLPDAERVVHLKAGRGLPYARVIEVMESCREAGAEEVALMTDPTVGG